MTVKRLIWMPVLSLFREPAAEIIYVGMKCMVNNQVVRLDPSFHVLSLTATNGRKYYVHAESGCVLSESLTHLTKLVDQARQENIEATGRKLVEFIKANHERVRILDFQEFWSHVYCQG